MLLHLTVLAEITQTDKNAVDGVDLVREDPLIACKPRSALGKRTTNAF